MSISSIRGLRVATRACILILMSNTDKAAAVEAVKTGTESAVKAYGWHFEDALDQAIRETAGEFGVSEDEIGDAIDAAKPWG